MKMIEKMARAMADADDFCSEPDYELLAKAALTTLLEPEWGMVGAMFARAHGPDDTTYGEIFTAAIQHALEE
jgi:hypothetical protein